MNDDEQLYTRRQLSIMLGRDRETISLALASFEPDGTVRTKRGNYPGYTIATAQRALRRRAGVLAGPDTDFDLHIGEASLRELLQ